MRMRMEMSWAALALGALAACAPVESRVRKGSLTQVIDQRPDRRNYLEAIGIGASDPRLTSDTQRKALARDAAIAKAQFELLSMVKGAHLEGGVTVDRALETDSSLESRVSATIRGAEILKTEFTSDSGCVVTLRLPKHRLEELMEVRFR